MSRNSAGTASSGTSSAQRSRAFQHRVRKRHPEGMFVGEGTSPKRMIRSRCSRASGSGTGTADSSTYPPVIQVSQYDLREIDGRRPLVGELRGSPEGLWLLTPDSLALEEPTGRLEALAGAKVWVVVDTTSRPGLVQSFGLIRPASP